MVIVNSFITCVCQFKNQFHNYYDPENLITKENYFVFAGYIIVEIFDNLL